MHALYSQFIMKRTHYTLAILFGALTAPLFAQIPNAGFEDWDSLSVVNNIRIYNPNVWGSSNIDLVNFNGNQTVEMTTDAHSGKYAVKLTSALDDEQLQATYLSSGYSIGAHPDDQGADKFPLRGRINGFEGYYKYFPHNPDSFRVYIALYRNGKFIGQAYMETGAAANTYTKFSWPVVYPAAMPPPDSAKLIIEPSIFADNEGSVLYMDDLNITYGFTSGVNENIEQPKITVYPNPAIDEMTLLGFDPRHRHQYQLTGMDGKTISSGELTEHTIQIGFLNTGLYILTLINEEGQVTRHKFAKN
jgi:hypothetical protein